MRRDYRAVGFEWDEGNRDKCLSHGVSMAEIESLFQDGVIAVFPDPHQGETRLRAVGRTTSGRSLFVVYTHRYVDGNLTIRPISARYMHSKEVRNYDVS